MFRKSKGSTNRKLFWIPEIIVYCRNKNGRDCKTVFAVFLIESYFYEESVKSGSVGEIFASLLIENNINVHFKHIAIDDEFVKQASVCRQLEHYNLDKNSIIKEVNNG